MEKKGFFQHNFTHKSIFSLTFVFSYCCRQIIKKKKKNPPVCSAATELFENFSVFLLETSETL